MTDAIEAAIAFSKERQERAERIGKGEYETGDFEEILEFLQGTVPRGLHITDVPKMTKDQAWSTIWYLQTIGVLPDGFELCDCCGEVHDTDDGGDWVSSTGEWFCPGCAEHEAFDCFSCGEAESKDVQNAIGATFIVLEPTRDDVDPGIYRVVGHPMYTDAIIDSWLHRDSLELISRDLHGIKGDDWYPCGFLCGECADKIDRAVYRAPWLNPLWERLASGA